MNASNIAYIIYTSGSTGTPKGVAVSHANLSPLLHWGYRYFSFKPGDRTLQNLSFYFDYSAWEMFMTLTSGATLVVAPDSVLLDPLAMIAFICDNGITILHITPSQLQFLMEPDQRLTTLKQLHIGAERLPVQLAMRCFEKVSDDCRVFNLYGPTEAAIISTAFQLPRPGDSLYDRLPRIPIGETVGNSKLLVLDSRMNLCPVFAPGELYIAGDAVAAGYLNAPDKTDAAFVTNIFQEEGIPGQRLYKTGDLVRRLPGGDIDFISRIDSQVKIRGFRIEIGEIENQLLSHDAISEAAVIAVGEGGEKYLCAYIVPKGAIAADRVSGNEQGEKMGLSTAQLKTFLAGKLPNYMIPADFIRIPKIPLTPNGKLDVKALPDPRDAAKGDITPPRNEKEERLIDIWQEILGLDKERIGIDTDFFKSGGHSLRAARLITRIHKEFNVSLSIEEIFNLPTIRRLSAHMAGASEERFQAVEAAEKRDYYPLASAQKRLYILEHLEPGSTGYNIPALFQVAEGTDKEGLIDAFRQLFRRHESFRTAFIMQKDRPVQRILAHVDFELEEYPATSTVNQVLDQFIRPFDLSKPPLMRAGLVDAGEEGCFLLLDIHHIITDGISLDIVLREAAALYEGNPLPPLTIQYKDYAQWQNSEAQQETIKKQGQYWQWQFAGELPLLNLPLDFPRPDMWRFDGDFVTFELEPKLTRGLRDLARHEGVTLFMLLAALLNCLLAKLGGTEEVVIGTPAAGRGHSDLENVVGMFVNTLALRTYPAGDKAVSSYLGEVRKTILEAFENQDFPFEELVEQLRLQPDTGRNPLFDVMLSLHTRDDGQTGNSRAMLTPYNIEGRSAKFDLTLVGIDAGDRLYLEMEYSVHLFKKETIQRMAGYFRRIAQAVVQSTVTPLADLDILTGEEKQELLVTLNDTGVDYSTDQCLHRLFLDQARSTPDSIALVGLENRGQVFLTYRRVQDAVERLAKTLISKGVGPCSIVGIMGEFSPAAIVGMLAVLRAGGAYLPIDPASPLDRTHYMLRDSRAKLLLTAKLGAGKSTLETQILPVEPILEDQSQDGNGEASASGSPMDACPMSPAYIMYTSGTTGKPKGVVVEHRSVANLVQWFGSAYNLKPGVRVLQLTRYTFDPSVEDIYATLLFGGVLHTGGKEVIEEPGYFTRYVRANRIHMVNFVPAMLRELLMDSAVPGLLEVVIAGGERLEDAVKEEILARGYRLYNHYGPTEITVDALADQCTAGTPVSIGRPIANTNVYIVDRFLRPVPKGVAGELCIGGTGLARGYLNSPEMTDRAFVPSPFNPEERLYRTGDLCRMLPEGKIHFMGRLDRQVKIRGFRIELEEIENRLLTHEAIRETVVVAVEPTEEADGPKNAAPYLCAYVVFDPEISGGSEITGDFPIDKPGPHLKEFLLEQLPDVYLCR